MTVDYLLWCILLPFVMDKIQQLYLVVSSIMMSFALLSNVTFKKSRGCFQS